MERDGALSWWKKKTASLLPSFFCVASNENGAPDPDSGDVPRAVVCAGCASCSIANDAARRRRVLDVNLSILNAARLSTAYNDDDDDDDSTCGFIVHGEADASNDAESDEHTDPAVVISLRRRLTMLSEVGAMTHW